MQDVRAKVAQAAALMKECGLAEVEMSGDGWSIELSRLESTKSAGDPIVVAGPTSGGSEVPNLPESPPITDGTVVRSPMNGIFYRASSPSSPPFAHEGQTVTAGDIVGLIEAMKVFNEVPAPTSGIVTRLVAQNGQLVQPGDVLLIIS